MSAFPMNGSNRSVFPDDSPLKRFVQAKQTINGIFESMNSYMRDTKVYLESQQVLSFEKVEEVEGMVETVEGIKDVLRRDIMKVAFFGRTSNGKSTVINTVLRTKILPSGMGHTTNCFLQVEGTDSHEAYLISDDSPMEKKNVESVSSLANALTSNSMGDDGLVRIFWPKRQCPLLRDDVVIVDSPGIDVSPNIDEWIDKYCHDADVFILVSNAESTLMQTEKAFFHKVSKKLSKPNIFILNNRWDAIASEPENEELVRKQHMERDVSFLVDELGVVTKEEAKRRVFFVSAKETLQYRTVGDSPTKLPRFADGFEDRFREFEEFEREFEECLSLSAVRTKFDQHTKRGKRIMQLIKSTLDSAYIMSRDQKREREMTRIEVQESLMNTQQNMHMINNEVKDMIRQVSGQVETKVCAALNAEIKRLSVLVKEFTKPFDTGYLHLSQYKKEMHGYVGKGLEAELRARLTSTITECVETAQHNMVNRVEGVVGTNDHIQFPSSFKGRNKGFEILYRLNCDSLCADFQEDLEFKFSLGLVSLMHRIRGKGSTKPNVPRHLPPPDLMSPESQVDRTSSLFAAGGEPYLWEMMGKTLLAAPQSQGVAIMLVGSFISRTVGWRVVCGVCAIYGAVYMYEYFTWNTKAKEFEFKKQYVDHATKKLKLIVDLTSVNCSAQVQQELSSNFNRMSSFVEDKVKDMSHQVNCLDCEIDGLSYSANNAMQLRDRADTVLIALESFKEKYLLSSPSSTTNYSTNDK